jgi:hypothetical protein
LVQHYGAAMTNSKEDLQTFEAQQPCGYAAAELLLLASGGDCAEAKAVFDQWRQTDEAKADELKYFLYAVYTAQRAIEEREGQVRKLTTPREFAEAIAKYWEQAEAI